MKLNLSNLFSSAALALVLVGSASATTITSGGHLVAGEGMMSSQANATTVTFDGLSALPSGFTATGTTPSNSLATGNAGAYSEPASDSSTFLATGTGSITDQLKAGTSYFGFYWGSMDSYNTFSLTETNGTVLSYSGSQIASQLSLTADGTQSYFLNFTADPGMTFKTATFTSSRDAFEIDNVASATPEPGTIAMLAGGLLVVAGAFRRRKA